MRVLLLGPVEVWADGGREMVLSRRQQRLILGILALEPNRPVSRTRLVDLIWGERPPPDPFGVIQKRISELRAILSAAGSAGAGAVMVRVDNGYVFHADPQIVDVHQFRQLVDEAHAAADAAATRELLRSALRLWRGQVLGGLLSTDSHDALCRGIESARQSAVVELFDIELGLGRHDEVVDEIVAEAAAHAGDERLTAQLMRALYHCGRVGEALQVYDRHRRWLAEELGADPGSGLQELHLDILRSSPGLAARRGDVVTDSLAGSDGGRNHGVLPASWRGSGPEVIKPRLLPPTIPDFTGRDKEVVRLTNLLAEPAARSGPLVVAVSGPGGVGKTALCVHVAHRLALEYPDGQLFADVRDESAAEVLGRFLAGLGVDPIPEEFKDRVDLYRMLMADRRVLVVLDDVTNAEDVRPLIPAGESCAILINGRTRLAGALGADIIALDVLDPGEALDLFVRVCGRDRVGPDAMAAAEVVTLCGYLPLAIRIAAAKLAAKPHWNPRSLADRLRDARRRLDHLSFGDLDVRASVLLSYQGLAPRAGLLLCRLGGLGLPEVSVWTAAALLDAGLADAEELLEQLYDAQLLDIAGNDSGGYARYRLHDLVQVFARERARVDERPDELAKARVRALGVWLFLADALYTRLPGIGATHSPAPRWPIETELVDKLLADPLQWFDRNRGIIAALIRLAATRDRRACWDLACTTSELFELRRYYDEWDPLLSLALNAARHEGDTHGQAATLHRQGMLCADRQDYQTARDHFQTAADLYQQVGDLSGYAMVTALTGMIDRWRGDTTEALRRYEEALRVLPAGDNDFCHIYALRGIGQIHLASGEHARAADYLDRALAAARRCGHRRAEAMVLVWQARLLLEQRRSTEARSVFDQVLILSRGFGDRTGEIHALRGIGRSYLAEGDVQRATEMLHEARRLAWQPQPTRLHAQIDAELAEITNRQAGKTDA